MNPIEQLKQQVNSRSNRDDSVLELDKFSRDNNFGSTGVSVDEDVGINHNLELKFRLLVVDNVDYFNRLPNFIHVCIGDVVVEQICTVDGYELDREIVPLRKNSDDTRRFKLINPFSGKDGIKAVGLSTNQDRLVFNSKTLALALVDSGYGSRVAKVPVAKDLNGMDLYCIYYYLYPETDNDYWRSRMRAENSKCLENCTKSIKFNSTMTFIKNKHDS